MPRPRAATAPPLLSLLALAALLPLAPPLPAQEAPLLGVTVYLVRHAEKRTDQGGDPELSDAGRNRAQELARILADAGVTALYASELRRTRLTLEPLAARSGLEIRTVEAALTVATLTAETLRREHPGGTVVVASHSNLMAPLVLALSGETVPEISEEEYDTLFVIRLPARGPGTLSQRRYGASSP